jgi:hypothetical protein
MMPIYADLPSLTITQIGGSASMSFSNNHSYTTGYNYVYTAITMGYYLVQGYLDLTPVTNNQTIVLGLSKQGDTIDDDYSLYHKFSNTDRVYLQFNYYVNVVSDGGYYFIFYSNSTVVVTKGKCTFIRIA